MIVRPLTDDDLEQSHRLAGLTFGYPVGDGPWKPHVGVAVGAFDDRGRLLARAGAKPYRQWWGGREVEMAGVAAVGVHPDGRGQGLVRPLMDALLAEAGVPLSVLFPTAAGIYRGLGWEVVGTQDDTLVPLAALPGAPPGAVTRSLEVGDLDAVHALYRRCAPSGHLTREGAAFPDGIRGLLQLDVVTLVHEDGELTGWVSYSRGSGYRNGGPLRVWDLVAATPVATRALLASLGSWSAVVGGADVRGARSRLAVALPGALPAPHASQPWMLRVVDPVRALAARGWDRDGTVAFACDGQGLRVTVTAGEAELTDVPPEGLPSVHPRGLALLYAGVGDRLDHLGLADRPVPELESLFRGPAPEIADYF